MSRSMPFGGATARVRRGGAGSSRALCGAAPAPASASALEPQCRARTARPAAEVEREPRVGSAARAALSRELSALCRSPPVVPIVVGAAHLTAGERRGQAMPFERARLAACYHRAGPDLVEEAIGTAVEAQPLWERTPPDERCRVMERAADLLAGRHRERVAAACVLGQGATAVQADRGVCRLVDHLRVACHHLRELAADGRSAADEPDARYRTHYHGLEGFWAAITPSDSVARAAQLALTPALMGNGVVWKPSDASVLACHRVLECLLIAGLPPGVVNFAPAPAEEFLERACASDRLAGVAFGGTTATLEEVCRRVASNVAGRRQFPRVVAAASGCNFHAVHASAHLPTAAACTARAAFEMAGQKATSCSRAYVAESLFDRFVEAVGRIASSLVVCHPLDYRCFASALVSEEAFVRAVRRVEEALGAGEVRLVCGGRHDARVGWFVQPTVLAVRDPLHPLLLRETRAPLLTVCPVPDGAREDLVEAIAASPYALAGSVFAQDTSWSRWAVGALRDAAGALRVNDRCGEGRPGRLPLGGVRKSGTGAKAGSLSYLLQFASERSLQETLRPCADVTYGYMDECPPPPAPRPQPARPLADV